MDTSCPHCGKHYRGVPDAMMGRRISCWQCKREFVFGHEPSAPKPEPVPPKPLFPSAPAAPEPPPSPAPVATRFEPAPRPETPRPSPVSTRLDSAPAATRLEMPVQPVATRILPTAELNPGDVLLDLYEVKSLLGQGAMGSVHLVRHRGWQIDLAVKSPRPEILAQAGGAESFEKEAETWVNLGLHPHTVSCYYVRRIDEQPRVFAEYVEGGSLAEWIADGRLYGGGPEKALARILDVAVQFAWGLHYAHEQGLVHQDVKPANVMMTPEGVAKVTDFGLARGRPPSSAADGNGTAVVRGAGMTPAYASPEQAEGRPLTRRTDIWSWGVSVLEMFAGERTWAHGSVAREALDAYLQSGPEREGAPRMPDDVAALLRRCFSADPEARPGNMKEAAGALLRSYAAVSGHGYPRTEPEAAPNTADSLNNRALSLLDLGRRADALALWQQALDKDNRHPETIFNRGVQLWRSNELTDGDLLRDLREAASSRPGDWVPPYLQAQVHVERGDYLSAQALLEGIAGKPAAQHDVRAALELTRRNIRVSSRPAGVMKGHTGKVYAVAFSRDGTVLVSGGEDGIRRWDVESGQCTEEFEGHKGAVRSLSMSADGRYLLSGGADGTARLWETETGLYAAVLREYSDVGITAVSLSGDGKLAVLGGNHVLSLWDVKGEKRLRSFDRKALPPDFVVISVALSGDGRLALSGTDDHLLRLWDVSTGQCVRTMSGHTSYDLSVHCDTAGRLGASGSRDSTVRLWDLNGGSCTRTLTGHRLTVHSVRLSEDGRRVLSGAQDSTVRLWDATTGRCVHTFEGHDGNAWMVSFGKSDTMAASAGGEGTVRVWQLPLNPFWHVVPAAVCRVRAAEAALSAERLFQDALDRARKALGDGQNSAAATAIRAARAQPGYSHDDRAMEIWARLYDRLPRTKLQGAWQTKAFTVREKELFDACLSGDRRWVLSAAMEGCRLWDAASGACVRTFAPYLFRCAAFSPDNQYALAGGNSSKVHIWDAGTGELVREFNGHDGRPVLGLRLSDDGRYLLSGGMDKTVKAWEFATGKCLRTLAGHEWDVNSVTFVAGVRQAASASSDKTVRVWDVVSGKALRTLQGHRDGVRCVRATKDGTLVVSASADHTIKIWQLSDGQCLRTLEGHSDQVHGLDISADGRYILSASADRTVRLWELETGRCVSVLEGHTQYAISAFLSSDGAHAVSAGFDGTTRLWILDWDLGDPSAPPQ